MAAYHALQQPGVRQVVQPPVFAVALAPGIHQRQATGAAWRRQRVLAQKALLQRNGQAFGKTNADKAARGHGVAIADVAHGLGCGDYFAVGMGSGSGSGSGCGVAHGVQVFQGAGAVQNRFGR